MTRSLKSSWSRATRTSTRFDADLLALEEHPDSTDLLASIFRTIHTIKGTCGFLGFGKLEHVTHVDENLLSLLRDGRLELTKERATALLSLGDAVRSMLSTVEQSGQEGDRDYSALVIRLQELTETDGATPEPVTADTAEPVVPEPGPEPTEHLDDALVYITRSDELAAVGVADTSSSRSCSGLTRPLVRPGRGPGVAR